jgi:hypothetical protein
VDFAREPSVPRAQAIVQGFLHKYVENSYKERVVLGPEERVLVRAVNSAYSVIEVWRRLVAAADFKVLRAERAALRRNDKLLEANRLFLKWAQEGEAAKNGRDPPIQLSRYVELNRIHHFPPFSYRFLDPLVCH